MQKCLTAHAHTNTTVIKNSLKSHLMLSILTKQISELYRDHTYLYWQSTIDSNDYFSICEVNANV